jgi:lipopolysaccharide transport system ATP-binding protein
MDSTTAVSLEAVSKKYCKSLKRSMLYGLEDFGRNALGIRSRSETLRADEFWAVDDVTLEIKRGESVGLIGPNGSGKTTLLKMISGIFWPDRGRLSVRGRVGALIAVGAGFHPLLTGRENVYINGAILGMSKRQLESSFDAIVDFADIGEFLDTPVKHYSSGMFVRLGFAVAVHSDPDVMLVDEVLAVGDVGFQTKCFKKMGELRERGTTFVVVSHNMHTIAGFSDWVALMRHGRFARYDDPFEGLKEYARSFVGSDDGIIEKLVSSGSHIDFHDVELGKREIEPGQSFAVRMPYRATVDYLDVELDVAIYDERDAGLYYQATNHAYGRRLDLPVGEHELCVSFKNIPISGSIGRIVVALWAKNRTEQLFWWRIPVEFSPSMAATGKNFLPLEFEVRPRKASA